MAVGKVLDALESSEYADNTIVYLWTDHGYHLGENVLFKNLSLWDWCAHVPIRIVGPG